MNTVYLFLVKRIYILKAFFNKRVYLDYASITPAFPFVYRRMLDVSHYFFANPSSLYDKGVRSKELLDKSRKVIADTLSAHADEIFFTGSGTEANNLAIRGVIDMYDNPHVVISSIEHPSVRELITSLSLQKKCSVTIVPVDKDGLVDIGELKKSLRPETVLVSVMYVNNEIGAMNDIKEVSKTVRHYKKSLSREVDEIPYVHTDAAQAFIHANMKVTELGVDILTLDGGKCYGPRGIGVLYKKRSVKIKSQIIGGAQESGLRAGTENLPSIVGLSEAMSHISRYKDSINKRVEALHEYTVKKIEDLNKGATFSSQKTLRKHKEARQSASPHIINICLPNMEGEFAVFKLDSLGVEVSSVTSCQNLKEDSSSYVVAALGNVPCAKKSLRISIGLHTTKAHIDKFIDCLTHVL